MLFWSFPPVVCPESGRSALSLKQGLPLSKVCLVSQKLSDRACSGSPHVLLTCLFTPLAFCWFAWRVRASSVGEAWGGKDLFQGGCGLVWFFSSFRTASG